MKEIEFSMDGRTVSYFRDRLYLEGYPKYNKLMVPFDYYPEDVESACEKCRQGVEALMDELIATLDTIAKD